MSFTIEGIENVVKALPNAKIAVLEAGWATIANEFGDRSNQANQKLYYNALKHWAEKTMLLYSFLRLLMNLGKAMIMLQMQQKKIGGFTLKIERQN